MTNEADRIRLRGRIDERTNPNYDHRSRVNCEYCGGIRYAGEIDADFACNVGYVLNPEYDATKANEFASMAVWVCANCADVTPRQRRVTARIKRLNTLLEELSTKKG